MAYVVWQSNATPKFIYHLLMHHFILWIIAALLIGLISIIFLVRRFRREAGVHERSINWRGDDTIHYDMDDDTL